VFDKMTDATCSVSLHQHSTEVNALAVQPVDLKLCRIRKINTLVTLKAL